MSIIQKLKSMIAYFLVGLSVLCLACEDVIDVDLDSAEPRIVIDGRITAPYGSSSVQISRSSDYFSPGEFPPVSGASVNVSVRGYRFDFVEAEPGLYTCSFYPGQASYRLTVMVDSVEYTATSTMPPPLRIYSLKYWFQEGNAIEDEGYLLHCFFWDRVSYDDYAVLRLSRNGKLVENIYLYNGKWSDGKLIDYDYFFEVFDPGDTVEVSLRTIDKAAYDYYSTLAKVIANDEGVFPQGVPANPVSNLSNGALGCFVAYTDDRLIVIMPATKP